MKGTLTEASTASAGRLPIALTLDAEGQFAYVANFDSGDVTTFAVNSNTGALTATGSPVPAGTGTAYIAFSRGTRVAQLCEKEGEVLAPSPGTYTITRARWRDLPRLPAIELAAARLLAGHAPDTVLRETTSLDELQGAYSRGHLWVALSKDVPVGFAHVDVLEPQVAHLKEIDVDPAHGQRGIGTRLMTTVCDWAASAGYAFVTLTTFRDVPFNMPFYAKLGFVEIGPEDRSRALCDVVRDEIRRGLDPTRRVAMRRPCPGRSSRNE